MNEIALVESPEISGKKETTTTTTTTTKQPPTKKAKDITLYKRLIL